MLADRLTVVRESLGALPAAAGGSDWERGRDEAVRAARALQEIIETHLDHEEDVAFSRYRRAFSAAEFAELGTAAWKVVGTRAVLFAGPWVLDHATAGERAEILGSAPLLLRVLHRVALRPRFRRLARPLRELSSPPSSRPTEV